MKLQKVGSLMYMYMYVELAYWLVSRIVICLLVPHFLGEAMT